MAGCAAAQFLKNTFVQSFGTLISALIAAFISLWWFEPLSDIVIKQEMIVDYARVVCFGMLFIIAFAVLQTAAMALTKQKIDLGLMPERIGRIIFGLLLGYVISGVILIGASIASLPADYPYPRFDSSRPDVKNPKKALLNPDGFLSGWFGLISSGSMSGSQSFNVLHAGFIDELFINRIPRNPNLLTDPHGLAMQQKSIWPASEPLKDAEGKAIQSNSNEDVVIVRIGFTGKADTSFYGGQLRVLCKKKDEKPRLGGKAVTVYPIGYIKSGNEVKQFKIGEQVSPEAKQQNNVPSVDFVCYVPKDYEPVAVGLKANAITEAPSMVTAEQAKETSSASQQTAAPQDVNTDGK